MGESKREELGTKDFCTPAREGSSLFYSEDSYVQGQVAFSFEQPCLAEGGPCLGQGC